MRFAMVTILVSALQGSCCDETQSHLSSARSRAYVHTATIRNALRWPTNEAAVRECTHHGEHRSDEAVPDPVRQIGSARPQPDVATRLAAAWQTVRMLHRRDVG